MARPNNKWSDEENRLFEDAVAEIDPNSSTFFEDLAAQIPSKSIGEVMAHYESALIQGMEHLTTDSTTTTTTTTTTKGKAVARSRSTTSISDHSLKMKETVPQPRRKCVPWTAEEHMLFLMGLNNFGRGDWSSISKCYTVSKTPTQVASHAQKYYNRQSRSPASRRRPSVNDVNTVIPATPEPAANARFPTSPAFKHSYGMGAFVLTQTTPPPPNAHNNPPSTS